METEIKDFPKKYQFLVNNKVLTVKEVFELYKNEPIENVKKIFDNLKNLHEYRIDRREFFSMADYFREDHEKIKELRLKKFIKRKGEVLEKDIIKMQKYQDELDFEEQLFKERIKEYQNREKYELLIQSIEKSNTSQFEFFDDDIKNIKRTYSLDLTTIYSEKEIFNKLVIDENMFYVKLNELCKISSSPKFMKFYDDDFFKEEEEKTNMLLCKFFFGKTLTKMLKSDIVLIKLNFQKSSLKLKFNVNKNQNLDDSIGDILKPFQFLNPKTDKIKSKTVSFVINNVYVHRGLYMNYISEVYGDYVYLKEDSKNFMSKEWLKYFLILDDKHISITMNCIDLEKSLIKYKNGKMFTLEKGDSIMKVNISRGEKKEDIEYARRFIFLTLDKYLKKEYNLIELYRSYGLKIEEKKIRRREKREYSFKELISDFKSGGISKQGKKERMKFVWISEREARKLYNEGEEVFRYPPKNYEDIIPIMKFEPIYIKLNLEYPKYQHIGLKKNTEESGTINNRDYPYIPMYFEKEVGVMDENWNLVDTSISKSDISSSKKSDKLLKFGEKGEVPKIVSNIINRNDLLKMGFDEGYSLLNILLFFSFNKGYITTDDYYNYPDFFEKIRSELLKKNLSQFSQELYDVNIKNHIEKLKLEDLIYEKHHKLLSSFFNINIFCFERTEKSCNIIVPDHKDFFIPNFNENLSAIFLIRNRENRYELVVAEEKGELVNITFNKTKKMLEIFSNMQTTNINIFYPTSFFGKDFTPTSQKIDLDGKGRTLTVKFKKNDDEEEVTLFTPVFAPLDLPDIKDVKKIKKFSYLLDSIDKKGKGGSLKLGDIEFTCLTSEKLQLPINEKLIFEDVNVADFEKARKCSTILKTLFGVMLFLSPKDFRYKVIEGHKYEVQYSNIKIFNSIDIYLLHKDLSTYITSNGQIIFSSNEMFSRFNDLGKYLMEQKRNGTLFFAPGPYIFNNKFKNISDFDVRSSSECIFTSNLDLQTYIFNQKNKLSREIFIRIPEIMGIKVVKLKKSIRINYPAKYFLPVNPFFFESDRLYMVQYLQTIGDLSGEYAALSRMKMRAKFVIDYWNKEGVNPGFYSEIESSGYVKEMLLDSSRTFRNVDEPFVLIDKYKTGKVENVEKFAFAVAVVFPI